MIGMWVGLGWIGLDQLIRHGNSLMKFSFIKSHIQTKPIPAADGGARSIDFARDARGDHGARNLAYIVAEFARHSTGQRQDRALDRRNEGSELHHVLLLVLLALVERMLKDGLDNAADAERGLHHTRSELAFHNVFRSFLDRHHLPRECPRSYLRGEGMG